MKKQAQELQKQMAAEQVTGTSADGTFNVTLNGNHELINVIISKDVNLQQPDIEKNIKEAYNDALDKLKTRIAQKFQGML